jgi:hypothetical protein
MIPLAIGFIHASGSSPSPENDALVILQKVRQHFNRKGKFQSCYAASFTSLTSSSAWDIKVDSEGDRIKIPIQEIGGKAHVQ